MSKTQFDEESMIFSLSYGQKDICKKIIDYVKATKDPKLLKTFMDKVLETVTDRLLHSRVHISEVAVAEWFRTFEVYISNLSSFSLKNPILRAVPAVTRLECFASRSYWPEVAREATAIISDLALVISKGSNLHLPHPSNASSDCFTSVIAPTVKCLLAYYAVEGKKSASDYEYICNLATEYQQWFREHGLEEPMLSLIEPQANYLVKITTDLVNEAKYFDSKFSLAKKIIGVITSLCVSIRDSDLLSDLLDTLLKLGYKMKISEVLDLHREACLDIMVASTEYESEFFVKWCDGCNALVEVLKGIGIHRAQDIILKSTKMWDVRFSSRLPGPIPLVHQWVKIQIEKGITDADGPTLLGELFPNEVSCRKILQQELLLYQSMQNKNAAVCGMMQRKITDLLKKRDVVTPRGWLEEARNLRRYGFVPTYCILYLNQVIRVAAGVQLGIAYCLRALCREECQPNSKGVFGDIQRALTLLKNHMSVDSMVPPMEILYSILDFLSLKGRVDLHCAIYEVMGNIYTQKKLPLGNLLVRLWESRRLSHGLCPSPILDTFINMSNLFGDKLMQTDYWLESFGTSQPLTLRFTTSFPFSQSDLPVTEIKEAASQLSDGSHTGSYLTGYMYYDLCENLISHGRYVEALPYAMEAYQLRNMLVIEKNYLRGTYAAYRKTGKELVHFRSIASELWSFDASSSDLEMCFISPWSLLQCYLESSFQVGVILEILGNGSEACKYLESGESSAKLHGLTMFSIIFSSFMGEIHLKKQDHTSAKTELENAKKLLSDSIIEGICPKCRVIHDVTVSQRLADLNKSSADVYKEFLQKLYTSDWKRWSTCFAQHDIERDISSLLPSEEQWDVLLDQSILCVGAPCICKNMKCLRCLYERVKESGLVAEQIQFKWGLVHRRILLKLLTGLGKCLENEHKIHEAIQILMQSISVLVGPNPFSRASNSAFLPDTTVMEFSAQQNQLMLHCLLGIEMQGDFLSIERALVLYDVCWLSLKGKGISSYLHAMIDIPISKLVAWLIQAFIRCRDVPQLYKKVSELLAAIFSLSTSVLKAQLSTSCKDLCGRHWVSFFHQASLGNQFDHQFLLKKIEKCSIQGSFIASQDTSYPRLVPDSVLLLKQSVKSFFENLPTTSTVICLSMLDSSYESVFQALMYDSSYKSQPTWMMVSRLDRVKPIHILLPLERLHGEWDELLNSGLQCHSQPEQSSTIIDHIAPGFGKLIESEASELNKVIPETQRKKDTHLGQLLKKLEDSWFGTMKYVLLGTMTDTTTLDRVCEEIVNLWNPDVTTLDRVCEEIVNLWNPDVTRPKIDSDLMRIMLLGMVNYAYESSAEDTSEHMLNFCQSKGCFVGGLTSSNEHQQTLKSIVSNTLKKFRSNARRDLKPTILILDDEVQMLPWENLSSLGGQEVYRMPSVWSVLDAYTRDRKINVHNAYYLLDPDCDLRCSSVYERLFREYKLKGEVGMAPSYERLAAALTTHEFFIYIGHGSGSRYISDDSITILPSCPTAVLGGCSSMSLKLNGPYVPQGTAMAYLLGGSVCVLGNLWDVWTGEEERFLRPLLTLALEGKDGKMLTFGKCIRLARQNLSFPLLIGAAAVCYGVPHDIVSTVVDKDLLGIRRKSEPRDERPPKRQKLN